MIVILKPEATDALVKDIVSQIEALGLQAHLSRGQFRTVIGVVGEEVKVDPEVAGRARLAVERMLAVGKPAARAMH